MAWFSLQQSGLHAERSQGFWHFRIRSSYELSKGSQFFLFITGLQLQGLTVMPASSIQMVQVHLPRNNGVAPLLRLSGPDSEAVWYNLVYQAEVSCMPPKVRSLLQLGSKSMKM